FLTIACLVFISGGLPSSLVYPLTMAQYMRIHRPPRADFQPPLSRPEDAVMLLPVRRLRETLMRAGKKPSRARPSSLAVPREALRLARAWVRHGVFGMPARLAAGFIKDPAFDGPMSESRFFDAFGENALRL